MKRNIILLIILVLALAVLTLFYPFLIEQGRFREFVFVDIITALIVGLISAFAIIVLIEDKDRRLAIKLEKQKQSVVVNKMIIAINEFNQLVAQMYKATANDAVSDFQERLDNLFYETDALYEQINKLDLKKDGPMISSINMKPIKWFDLFHGKLGSYLKQIAAIEENYLFLMDGDIIKEIENITRIKAAFDDPSNLHSLKLINDGVNATTTEAPNAKAHNEKVIFLLWGLYYIILSTAKLMNLIDTITERKNFSISADILLREDVSPRRGSGLMS